MYHVQQRDQVSVIEVDGELDMVASSGLASAIKLAAESVPAQPVVVSLENCSFCDSTGLGILVTAKKALGLRLRVVGPQRSPCRRVFDLTGLTEHLPLYASLGEAIAAPMVPSLQTNPST